VDIPVSGRLKAEVFDPQGRRIALLIDEERAAGRHELEWAAFDIPSGAYWVRISTSSGTATHPVVRVR
jgi:hypothetical protein